MKKNYENIYNKQINNINYPQNVITRVFLSRFSPIKQNFKNKKIIDFSCGAGPYLNLFLAMKMKVYASEISNVIVNKLKKKFKKVKFLVSDTKKIDFKKNFFDFFFANHSIYYLNDIGQDFQITLKNIHKSLKKNGIFICTFPNIKQKHIIYKKLNKKIYYAKKDLYNLRLNSYFYLFKNSREIKNDFKYYFNTIHIGNVKINFKNLNENYYICIFKKK